MFPVNSNTFDDSEVICGIGSCTPTWLQRFANPKVFLCFFSLTGIVQGAFFTYFSAISSTLEKRYAFDSSYIGLIFIADNISHGLFSIFVGYYGKFVNRPKFLTFGMIVTILSCILSSTPYFIYGAKDLAHPDRYSMSFDEPELCMNAYNDSNRKCNHLELSESSTAISILFLANFLNGCGSLIYYTIGISYLDDNIKKKQSPLYLGALFSSRTLGPTAGFYLSSICLKFYENPYVNPGYSNDDPRWLGSWWIGFLIIGIFLAVVSLPLALFPERFRKHTQDFSMSALLPNRDMKEGICSSLKKLLKNPILMFHTLSMTFQINGIYGYYTFMTKYIENQYRHTASKASFFSGTTVLVTTTCSIFLGSVIIQKWKPKPTVLVGYMLFVELFAVVGLISALFFGCSTPPLYGLQNKSLSSFQNCSKNCGCDAENFLPVCHNSEAMFYSPCHAGCSSYTGKTANMTFHDCSCSSFLNNSEIGVNDVKRDFCNNDCDNFWPYYILLTLGKVFAFTAKVGHFLITLRCVPEEEKVLAISVVEFVVSLLATIPHPLIYGHVIDRTCLVWEKNCGKTGNCLLYDNDKFRNHLHWLSIGFLSIGLVCELVVFSLSKNLTDLYGQKTVKNCISTNAETCLT